MAGRSKIAKPGLWVPPKPRLELIRGGKYSAKNAMGLPFWVLNGKAGSTPPPVVPQPSDKAGMLWGLDPRTGVSFSSGINVSQVDDASGGSNPTTFGAGLEAEYQASYLSTGKPALKLLSSTLGVFGTTPFIDVAADHGLFLLLHNTVEAGTYYHAFLTFRTSVVLVNQSILVSNDSTYGTFGNITGADTAIGNTGATTTITTNPSALIWNYNGGVKSLPASYTSRLNNSPLTLTDLGGGTGNDSNGNYINSYGNTSPPRFPATDSFLLGAWLYDSPISDAEADAIFKPFAESYGITQA